jgi:hypothetical protein
MGAAATGGMAGWSVGGAPMGAADAGGMAGVVAVAICGEDVSLKLSHICVGEGGAGGVAHGTSFRLGIVNTLPLEVSQAQNGFLEGDDVVNGYGGALFHQNFTKANLSKTILIY